MKPIGIYYEHPEWFKPLFAELERRRLPYARIDASRHLFSPDAVEEPYSLVVNRMSPSAYLRGHARGIFSTLAYLDHLERRGVRVINGTRAYALEISKARQLSLLAALDLPYPKARVINDPSQALDAAAGLRFPVAVKPNIGGSGAGITRYDDPADLETAVRDGRVDLGLDFTALVQEFIPARGGHIVRVEVLNGRYLYAIRVFSIGESFNLCPADICVDGPGLEGTTGAVPSRPADAACVVTAQKSGIRVEGYTPPAEAVADVERIMCEAGIEVGGVEYIVDDRDGARLYYDINALSNFVAEAPRVIGFDPFVPLVDWLEAEAARASALTAAVARGRGAPSP